MSKAEVHILDDEAESERYIEQVWAEAVNIYRSGDFKLKLPYEYEKQLSAIQQLFMPEDDRLGVILGFLSETKEACVCSRMIYREAFRRYDEPQRWALQEINEVMNAGIASKEIAGWKRFDKPRRFREYGTQRGWERITQDEPEFTEIPYNLPDGLFDDKPSSR